MKTCIFKGKTISYTLTGSGPCLLLIHGFPFDSRVWETFRLSLERSFSVLTPDLPGFGQSEHISSTHSMTLMAESLRAILEHERIAEVVLLGHSMGGYVSLAFAHAFPEMMKGLILFHSRASGDDEAGKEARNATIQKVRTNLDDFMKDFVPPLFDAGFARSHPQLLQLVLERCREQTVTGIQAALAGMRDRESRLDLLTQLTVPVLFILGKNDALMPPAKIMAQSALPKHAELLLLEDVGHMGIYEKPDAIAPVVSDFATRCFASA